MGALDRDAGEAGLVLGIAVAAGGSEPVDSAAFAAQGEIELDVRTRSVAGVPIAEIEKGTVERAVPVVATASRRRTRASMRSPSASRRLARMRSR